MKVNGSLSTITALCLTNRCEIQCVYDDWPFNHITLISEATCMVELLSIWISDDYCTSKIMLMTIFIASSTWDYFWMFSQDIIQSMPHDAHPMGVLVSAMSALSIFHPDANPALRVSYIILFSLYTVKMSSSEKFHANALCSICLCSWFHVNSHWVQGQDIYKSKQVRDKQIVRILGKVLLCMLIWCLNV